MMPRWLLLSLICVTSCEGERVESPATDAQITETTTDSAPGDAADTPATGDCGEYKGAKMVRVGKYCIDTTEVTRGQFLEFLAAPVDQRNAARPAECAWNKTDPAINTTPAGLGLPVGDINFCDALAYCAWAKKRLCGQIGGGTLSPDDYNKTDKSEWFAVCSPDGKQLYPYGSDYDRATCFTEEGTVGATGTRTRCAGASPPYAAVFDLVGNVVEWENACTGSAAGETSTLCRTRGGSYGLGPDAKCAAPDLTTVNTRLPGVGLRCCKN